MRMVPRGVLGGFGGGGCGGGLGASISRDWDGGTSQGKGPWEDQKKGRS